MDVPEWVRCVLGWTRAWDFLEDTAKFTWARWAWLNARRACKCMQAGTGGCECVSRELDKTKLFPWVWELQRGVSWTDDHGSNQAQVDTRVPVSEG